MSKAKNKYIDEEYKKEIENLSIDELRYMLKELESQFQVLIRQCKPLDYKMQTIRNVISEKKGRGDSGVSDHALIRYLERCHGLDVVALKKEISERFIHSKNLESFEEKADAVIENNIVITIIKNQEGYK